MNTLNTTRLHKDTSELITEITLAPNGKTNTRKYVKGWFLGKVRICIHF